MSTVDKSLIQALTLCLLLATSWNAAADDGADPVPVSPTTFTAAEQTSNAESGNARTAGVLGAGLLSFLIPAIAWPLFGGVLVLAAVNSRKPRVRETRRTWRGPW